MKSKSKETEIKREKRKGKRKMRVKLMSSFVVKKVTAKRTWLIHSKRKAESVKRFMRVQMQRTDWANRKDMRTGSRTE